MKFYKFALPAFLGLIFFSGIPGRCELSKVYPTSSIAVVRLSAYQDAIATIYNSTYTVSYSTNDWDTTTNYLINQIADQEEVYMVWPDTGPCPSDWRGWGSGIVNGKRIAVQCP
jgi:hypothetical protein